MGNTIIPKIFSDYRKLLWTNPNPTAAFAAQTVSLDLSEYDNIELEMSGSAGSASTTTQDFKMTVGIGGLLSISANIIWWRYVTPRANGVEFGGGYSTNTYGSSATVDNTFLVPRKIYGIKYKRVVPGIIDAEIEPLAAGATLHRIGRMRMLVLSDFVYGTAMSPLASGDRPSSTATGMGLRYSNSAYFCFAFIAVNTNGTVSISNVGTYNTSAGVSTPGSGEKFNATVVWYVPD